jgi:hypothetical protein
VLRLALRQRGDHHGKAIDGDQDTADHGGGIEPGQVDLKARRRQRAVEQTELEPIPGNQQAYSRDQRVVEAVDPELKRWRQNSRNVFRARTMRSVLLVNSQRAGAARAIS